MRTVNDRPRTSRLRLVAVVAAGLVMLLFLSANGIARVFTDWLWFDQLGIGAVWTRYLGLQWLMALIFGVLFFLLFWGNLVLADRLKPAERPASAEEELVERYHALVEGQAGKVRLGLGVLFALIAGANTSAQWRTWVLFRNGEDFGRVDPLYGRDAGFYVFRLPMWTFIVDWFFAALILTLIVVLIAHYLNGGIRPSLSDNRVGRGVKIHVSVLLAALAGLRAVAYWFDRYELVTNKAGEYHGALATDVIIRQPALSLLALISIFCGVLIVYNIWRPGWGLPVVAIGIWLVSHFVVGNLFPLAYQRLRVAPVESQRETEWVAHNIEATRFAYGLDSDNVTRLDLPYEAGLSADDVEEYADILDNVPVVDPFLAFDEVTRNEAERKIFSFSSPLDVDRYQIDGQLRPVVLSARGLNVGEVGDTWERQHVIFTHGYGMAMAAAYDSGRSPVASESRALDFLVSELGNTDVYEGLNAEMDQPRVYFGEDFGGYAIIGADRQEVDYQTGNQSELFSYDGDGGVSIGSVLRRAAFALRFRQLDPLVSNNITDESRVIYIRDVVSRVRTMAPFLRFDSDPYPVLADGHIFWILNGYTTTNDYPYSQSVATQTAPNSSLARGYNYVRNSVKVVVDAYNGDVQLYVVDEEDPIIQAWGGAFPELFVDGDQVPPELEAHFRYPSELFTVQTDMWSNYVVSDPSAFIQGDVAWSIAAQPRIDAQIEENETANAGPMRPHYLMARLPDNEEAEYVLQRAFVPRGGASGSSTARPELTGLMMARSDPEHYGELVLFDLPTGQINAPDLVHAEIRKSQDLTEFIKDKAGAKVEFGEMSIVLVDDTIVYIRPVYVEANSATAVPELQRIVAVNGGRIFMARTVGEAIAGVVDGAEPVVAPIAPEVEQDDDSMIEGSPDTGGSYNPEGKSVVELIADADEMLLLADRAETDNPEEADRLRARAQEALQEARRLLGGGTAPPAPASTET